MNAPNLRELKEFNYSVKWIPLTDTRNLTALTPQATPYQGAEHTRSHTARAVKDGCANGHILELYYDPRSTTLQLLNPNKIIEITRK